MAAELIPGYAESAARPRRNRINLTPNKRQTRQAVRISTRPRARAALPFVGIAAACLAAYMVATPRTENIRALPPGATNKAAPQNTHAAAVSPMAVVGSEGQADPSAQSQVGNPAEIAGADVSVPHPPEPETKAEGSSLEYRSVTVSRGDSFYLIMKRLGLGGGLVAQIMDLGEVARPLKHLKPEQTLTVTQRDADFVALEYRPEPLRVLTIERVDGKLTATETRLEPDVELRYADGVIDSSLYVAASIAGLDERTIMALAEIFGWDIDFTLDLRQGDRFALLYEEKYLDGERIGSGNILAARLYNRDRLLQGIRHTTAAGSTSYYTAQGANLRKAFSRNPLPITRVTSRFNPNRLHPIFKTVRPHRGVDYGAAIGTPVRATGDGKVAFKGRKGGYGNVVILQHGQRYRTLYGHLNGFARGLRTGQRVRQGQTIAYVGQSGLATGPHLHYEFQVDGIHKDPLKVAFPHAEPVPAGELPAFQASAQSLLALLDERNPTQLAESAE